jgi:hypothetical protein
MWYQQLFEDGKKMLQTKISTLLCHLSMAKVSENIDTTNHKTHTTTL